jgi:hypothetical protein
MNNFTAGGRNELNLLETSKEGAGTMKAKGLIGLLVAVVTLGLASQAMAAYRIGYFHVQSRIYEDGTKFNRFYMDFRDENNQLLAEDLLDSSSVVLTDPNGQRLPVQDLVFYIDRELDGKYDDAKGIWQYNPDFVPMPGYCAVVPGVLVPGVYHLAVLYNGESLEQTYTVNRIVDLPITPAAKINCKAQYGNLICQWPVPMDLSRTDPTLETSARVCIDVIKASKIVAYVYVTVPMHMGRLYLPASVVNTIRNENGDSYQIQIQLRTNDNNNRSYSNPKKIL